MKNSCSCYLHTATLKLFSLTQSRHRYCTCLSNLQLCFLANTEKQLSESSKLLVSDEVFNALFHICFKNGSIVSTFTIFRRFSCVLLENLRTLFEIQPDLQVLRLDLMLGRSRFLYGLKTISYFNLVYQRSFKAKRIT